jgi:hypothetical protein
MGVDAAVDTKPSAEAQKPPRPLEEGIKAAKEFLGPTLTGELMDGKQPVKVVLESMGTEIWDDSPEPNPTERILRIVNVDGSEAVAMSRNRPRTSREIIMHSLAMHTGVDMSERPWRVEGWATWDGHSKLATNVYAKREDEKPTHAELVADGGKTTSTITHPDGTQEEPETFDGEESASGTGPLLDMWRAAAPNREWDRGIKSTTYSGQTAPEAASPLATPESFVTPVPKPAFEAVTV